MRKIKNKIKEIKEVNKQRAKIKETLNKLAIKVK